MTSDARPVPVLCLAGSTRVASFNRRLLGYCADRLAAIGAVPVVFDLGEKRLPLYDGDAESADGIPENAKALAEAIRTCNGLVLACPEYNAGMTGVLKNALDWASRVRPGGKSVFQGKVATLVSASPGRLGGLRGLVHTRLVLTELGCHVLADQVAVPEASTGLDESGKPTQAHLAAALDSALAELGRLAAHVRA